MERDKMLRLFEAHREAEAARDIMGSSRPSCQTPS
jgi:hypothetical protein